MTNDEPLLMEDGENESRLIARVKQLSSDTLDTAIERGIILKQLNLKRDEYELKRVGITYHTGYRLMLLVDHPRMQREDWEKPGVWTVCYEVLQMSDRCFVAMLGAGFINYHTTRRQVRDYVRSWRKRHSPSDQVKVDSISAEEKKKRSGEFKYLNEVICGDCLDLIWQLPNDSISAVITSPPYAEQRDEHYDSVPETVYPVWFCKVMDAIWPKLTMDGSVFVVIRSHISDGQVSDYVLRTRLMVRDRGWKECEELIWFKPDGPPLGSVQRPRRAFENILWFSKTNHPYVNLTACGRVSERIGFQDPDQHRVISGTSAEMESGISRITDVFSVGVNDIAKNVAHPAMYPSSLVRMLIESFTVEGSVVLDPFVGSGTTVLVAQSRNRDFVGFDVEQKFVDLAKSRLTCERI